MTDSYDYTDLAGRVDFAEVQPTGISNLHPREFSALSMSGRASRSSPTADSRQNASVET